MNYSMQYVAHKIIDSLDWSARVAEWNKKAGTRQGSEPDEIALAMALIAEEVGELQTAVCAKDKVEVADAIGDSIVTLLGLAYRLNVDMMPVMTAIFDSNNSKFLQGVHKREDGKITKGPAFVPPKINEALQRGRHMGRIGG